MCFLLLRCISSVIKKKNLFLKNWGMAHIYCVAHLVEAIKCFIHICAIAEN